MKINNLFFILILFIFSGCYIGPKNYDTFNKLNNSIIKNNISMSNPKLAYIKQDYNENEYIYTRL